MLINERKTHTFFVGLKVKKGGQAGADVLIIIIILNNQSAEILRGEKNVV